MSDRHPSSWATPPRIRPTQSGVRSARQPSGNSSKRQQEYGDQSQVCNNHSTSGHRLHRPQRHDYEHETGRRFDYRRRDHSPPPAFPPGKPLQSKRGRSSESTSARRTWLAAVFALCVAFLNRDPGDFVTSLQDIVLSERDWASEGERSSHLSFEIFSAPKPFIGADAVQQARAIESWLALHPRPEITLLGTGAGYAEVVRRYGLKWNRHVDTSFLGVPLFNSIVEVANASQADIAVLVNADIMLFDDFPFAVRKVHRDVRAPWMLVGARWDVSELPASLLKIQKTRRRPPKEWRSNMVRFARDNGTLHTYGGIDVWAWNTRVGVSLFDGIMPHFVFGRGKYDNWLTHEVITAGHRRVIDISEACTFVHVLHDHHLVTDASGGEEETWGQLSAASRINTDHKRSFWSQGARVKFELYINTYLAAAHGTYANQMGTILHAPLMLHSCYEDEGLCLFRRRRPHTCRCEHSPFVPNAQSDPFAVNDSRLVFCGLLSSDAQNIRESSDRDTLFRFVVSGRQRAYERRRSPLPLSTETTREFPENVAEAASASLHGALLEVAREGVGTNEHTLEGGNAFGLPLLLDKLLNVVERRTGSQRVVLTMLNSNSKSLLPRFICSSRRAGIFENVVIAALDDETYHYAVTRGFAVYLEESVYETIEEEVSVMGARIDSAGFQPLLSLRARVARRFTSLGREVFYADPDVVLLGDPFAEIPEEEDIAFLNREFFGGLQESKRISSGKMKKATTAVQAVSLAMFYVRPSKAAEAALTRLAKADVWERPSGGGVEAALETSGASYGVLPASKFGNVRRAIPPASERGEPVALHLAAKGEAYVKVDVWRRAKDLYAYDEMAEVCFADAEKRTNLLGRLRMRLV